jgi:cell division protein ZapA
VSKGAKGLDVNIMGREFCIACPEDERSGLLKAVDHLNGRMREIKESGKVVGAERIAIMAALNITHEFLASRADSGFDADEFKRRIGGMQSVIEQAMDGQDELF